ncbi:2-aminoethylphosphonate--pyruvate transaminase [Oleiphilus messinensis]|uniref:2-aminoethylphosphonate--pyruvate transaminase n=1 Tax=Oleiphilus messinensis TaxID=141451 RepID=A0A1Y0IC11_9GAMM|nr:2-aminoethylphosphonate--pyruvate transaminase [Oleiphilus messinensis]ARU58011.1 2-aminoethylphosphonate--pyruvate transaminase [Oleiphilus messinensis]
MMMIPDNPYLLLTPGPLSTSPGVREALLRDWCTWDRDYNQIVQRIRARLVDLATRQTGQYTSVLMQGSGSASVEAVLGSVIPESGRLLVLANGAYGKRIAQMARVLRLNHEVIDFGETGPVDLDQVSTRLKSAGAQTESAFSHVALVHCETTTGMLNDIAAVGRLVHKAGATYIVDAMSSFGGIPMDIAELEIDFLISSANKCIQGVPGFGFVIGRRDVLASCAGRARSLSLDLYDQWQCMEQNEGKWRFTSPTHVVRAFDQALFELEQEGGIAARYGRYVENHRILVEGMRALGFETLLPDALQSPFITTFYNPESEHYRFEEFYQKLKADGFVIYPGKISQADCFRIGNIGHVFPADIERLISAVERNRYWL